MIGHPTRPRLGYRGGKMVGDARNALVNDSLAVGRRTDQ